MISIMLVSGGTSGAEAKAMREIAMSIDRLQPLDLAEGDQLERCREFENSIAGDSLQQINKRNGDDADGEVDDTARAKCECSKEAE